MGKTKTKIIDDSQPIEKKPAKKLGRRDELVERLKAELATEEPKIERAKSESNKETREEAKGDSEEGFRRMTAASETSEDVRRDTELAGPRAKVKSQKPGKAKPRSKKYQEIVKDLDRSRSYPLDEAVELTKKLSYSKFTGTLEAHINTVQAGMRGLVSLPYASGKKLKILAFGPSQSLGVNDGVVIGDDSTIEKISKGKVDFDLVITTPEWMPKLAKIAKILGPRGLMPNPKNGTITDDLKKAVESFQAGKTEYKTESKIPVIHLSLGKLDQPTEQLSANIKTLLQTLGKTRIKKVSLSPTMGPSVRLDLSSL